MAQYRPKDKETALLIERFAPYVQKGGKSVEHLAVEKHKGNPQYAFLWDTRSNGYKYYKHLLGEPSSSSLSPKPKVLVAQRVPRRRQKRKERDPEAELKKMKRIAVELGIRDATPPPAVATSTSVVASESVAFRSGSGGEVQRHEDPKVSSSNRGYGLLSKMGWQEGQGLGRREEGRVVPVEAHRRQNQHGVGRDGMREDGRERDASVDAFRQRQMKSYKHRPNPLGNLRTPYY